MDRWIARWNQLRERWNGKFWLTIGGIAGILVYVVLIFAAGQDGSAQLQHATAAAVRRYNAILEQMIQVQEEMALAGDERAQVLEEIKRGGEQRDRILREIQTNQEINRALMEDIVNNQLRNRAIQEKILQIVRQQKQGE